MLYSKYGKIWHDAHFIKSYYEKTTDQRPCPNFLDQDELYGFVITGCESSQFSLCCYETAVYESTKLLQIISFKKINPNKSSHGLQSLDERKRLQKKCLKDGNFDTRSFNANSRYTWNVHIFLYLIFVSM